LTRWQWLIVLAHVLLALLYGVIVPPWEAHDETGHFAYVNHVVANRALPDAYSQDKVLFDQSHQPPLYYAVTSALTGWIDRSDTVQPQFNGFALDGTNRRGFRIMLRQPGEAFPWSGAILALHAARAVSAVLTALTIYLIARSLNTVFGRGSAAALLGTAIAAFNPQVLFMGAMVNNDAMVALTGALVGYWLLVIGNWSSNHQSPITHRCFVLLGLSLGLAFLSKNSAIALIGFVVLGLAFIAWRQRWNPRELAVRGALTLASFAVVAGPFLIYNLTRYGRLIVDRNVNNPILSQPTSVIGAGLNQAITDGWLPQLFANTFNTFWGKFGWGNVGMPEWVYWALAVFCVVGVIGVVAGVRHASREVRTSLALLALLGLAMMALPLYRAIYFQDPALMPGRYLMPALTAYAGLLGFGWAHLLAVGYWLTNNSRDPHSDPRDEERDRGQQLISKAIAAGLALFALIVPFAFIQPRYAPALISANQDPPLLTFGDPSASSGQALAQVTGVSAHTAFLPDREGMRHYARVRLTWRALREGALNTAFGISVLGRNNEVLGSMNVYPDGGNFPATNWKPGDTFVDEYDILLEKPCARLPALGKVNVTAFEFQPIAETADISITRALPALDGAGREIAPIIGRFKVDNAPPFGVFWQPPLANMDGIWLREVDLPSQVQAGSTITATLTYEMLAPNGRAGTAFVHLLRPDGQPAAQDDHPPQNGDYPTDLWDRGECVQESFTLNIPSDARGPLRAVTGFYASDGARFPTGTQDDLVSLGEIRVTPAP
jgi:4-amino-4-deoxy-L-arabinose transferase-like glycosyltransferase